MARKRIIVKKIREILKHNCSEKLSCQKISEMSDTELMELFKGKKEENNERYRAMLVQMPYFTKELKRTGVTRQLLWEEYSKNNPNAFGYSQFCHHLQCWQDIQGLSMKQFHAPGEKMFVDYTGDRLTYFDGRGGEQKKAEVFVAVLGASGLTYAEASESQKKESFIRSVEHSFRYFGGATKAIVPDNLKSAVTNASKYEPEVNPLFDDFAEYYRTAILPARAYRPKDKALVENAVRLMYQRIFAPLRNREFYSLEELNETVREKLEAHNNRKMQVLQVSRREHFEEIEKSELKTFPSALYPMKSFENHKEAPDYHVLLSADKHYSSVPWQLKGKQVRLIYDERTVAVYHDNLRVAGHYRDRKKGGYTTNSNHMPHSHQFYASWSVEKFRKWATSIGNETLMVINHVIESKKHPEQAFKSCIGILNLGQKNNSHNLNMACRRAWNYGRISYRDVKAYLDDIKNNKNEDDKNVYLFPRHENLRNTADYR